MTGEWKECKLREIATEIKSGGTPSTKHQEYYGGIIPWLNTKEIHFNRIRDTDIKITEAGLNNSSAKWVKENSIIVAMYGATAGKIAINKIPLTTNQACCNITPDSEKADYNFVYYNLCDRYNELVNLSCGAAQQNLNVGLITNLDIILPPLPEQRAIASVLSSLDDKIDLLHRQNKTLEAMAETLFRQWFVEEADEEWKECTLNDLCIQIASGGTPSTKIKSYYNGDINWYSTKELKDNFLYESENKITKEGLNNSSAKLFPAGTVVIAIYAAPTVGRLGILANEASFNQAACGLIANEEFCNPEFMYLYLKNQRNELNSVASGSAQQNLNVGKIKSYPAFKVPKDLMDQFKDVIQPIFKKINSNTLQIRILEKLRDTLLPKLMSGEVRVEFAQGEPAV